VQHFFLNHSQLVERKTNISIKEIKAKAEIQKCIDLFNSEIKWDGMFNVEQALDRIERGERMFVGYKNEDIFCYCWIKENHKDDYYIYNVFSKKPKSLRKIGVIDLLYLVIKNYTTGKIRAEIDDWNGQSQKVANRLGASLIHNPLITNDL
jgi:hypothetical protein